jgi:putative flippase GtrA
MLLNKFPKETIRIFKYLSIGVFTTLLTFLLWNLLIWFNDNNFRFEVKNWFSVSQYIASISLIYPSFYLNRKFTFADKKEQSKNSNSTILKAYLIYILAPLFGSITIFCVNRLFPEFINFKLQIINFILPFGRFFLQVFGLFLGVLINYFGQKFWLYK